MSKKSLVWWRRKHLTWDHLQVWYGRLLERSLWELRSGRRSLSFNSRGKRLSFLCRSGKCAICYCRCCFTAKWPTFDGSLQYHPEKNSYTWTAQPGQQIVHSKEVKLSFCTKNLVQTNTMIHKGGKYFFAKTQLLHRVSPNQIQYSS